MNRHVFLCIVGKDNSYGCFCLCDCPKDIHYCLCWGNRLNSDIIDIYWIIDPKAISLPTLSVRHESVVFTDIMSVICIMRILTIN